MRRRVARVAFGVVGLAFVVVALARTWDDSQDQLPGIGILVIAALLMVGGLVGGGISWITLFGPGAPRGLIADFYLAQLGKYVPGGGIWQAAGQVGLSTTHGLTAMRVAGNLAVHGVIQLTSAAAIGGLLVFATDLPGWLRLFCGLGLATPLLLHRTWMAAVLRRLGNRFRAEAADAEPPDQRTIIRSWLWSLLPITGFGLAYGVMIHTLDPGIDVWRGAVAFAMAWAVGFALLPFPAGLGVREGALLVLLGGSTAVVVTTSLALRLLAIVGDLILVAATRRIRS